MPEIKPPKMINPEKWMPIEDAAAMTGIPKTTICNWIIYGKINVITPWRRPKLVNVYELVKREKYARD